MLRPQARSGLEGALGEAGPGKRVAIIQTAYVPWRGFFDLIDRCDEYIMFDTAQFRKGHWHNRNLILTPRGPRWLTIPVKTAGRRMQAIEETRVAEAWAERHLASLRANYRRAASFSRVWPFIEAIYGEVAGLECL